MTPQRRRWAAPTVGVVLAALITSCSLPVDERVTPLGQDAFPDDLTEGTTTTTTTTTTTVPTRPTSTAPDPSVETTTTVALVPTEVVSVYFTRGVSDVLQPVEVLRPVGTPVLELVPLLERPAGITEVGLRTLVLPGLLDDIVVERGTASVSLDPAVLERMSNSNLQRAIAQIVLTVTSFRTVDAGAIGRIRFVVDGEGFPVFVPAFGGSSEPGEELSFTDFQPLIATTPTPATSTPSVPPTSAAPDPAPGDG